MGDFTLLLPEIVLALAAFAVFTVDLFLPDDRKGPVPWVAALGVVLTLIVSIGMIGRTGEVLGLVAVDAYANLFKIVFLLVALLVIGSSVDYVRLHLNRVGEFYALLLIATLGMNVLAASRELLTGYIALELMSFSFYVLAGIAKFSPKSNEAAIKYILMGAFSSAILLYGLSFIYGATQTTFFFGLAEALAFSTGVSAPFLLGLVLLVAGLGFKVSAVPFHQWAPDVYEGSPTPVTAFLSAGSKMAAFALFLALFAIAFVPILPVWQTLLIVLAAVSMTIGNLVALRQTNIIRLLAYSSIAQVGYVLVGLAALTPATAEFASAGLVFHLIGYAVTTLAAFAVVITVYNAEGKQEITDYAGLSRRSAFPALVMSIALFSLAGMPFFAGFFTKFYLFSAAVTGGLIWLVAFAVLNSFVSLYYYLQVIKQMYVYEPVVPTPIPVSPVLTGVLALSLIGIIGLGVYPTPLLGAIENAVGSLFR